MAKRTFWQQIADRLWPDSMDMVEPAQGDGRWATVAWCGGLSVELHRNPEDAAAALRDINARGCGHECWRDHELVDLSAPGHSGGWSSRRLARRLEHFRTCRVCDYVFDGMAAAAAINRDHEFASLIDAIHADSSEPLRATRAPGSRRSKERERFRQMSKRRRFAILARDGFRCRYCGRSGVLLHLDHVIPLSQGGTDSDDNLVTACADCNLGKRTDSTAPPELNRG